MEVKVDGIKSSYDAVIVGKSAGGLTAATAAKRMYPEKEILVIDNQQISMIPCGIPYIFGTLATIDDNRLPSEKMLDGAGVDLLIDEVTEIGADCKNVFTRGGKLDHLRQAAAGHGLAPHTAQGEGLPSGERLHHSQDL